MKNYHPEFLSPNTMRHLDPVGVEFSILWAILNQGLRNALPSPALPWGCADVYPV